mgnify:CR=1 FL=1
MRYWEGTSVLELIKIVEKVTGRKVSYVHKDYPVEEAERLVGRDPVLKDPTSLEVGIRRVAELIIRDEGLKLTLNG